MEVVQPTDGAPILPPPHKPQVPLRTRGRAHLGHNQHLAIRVHQHTVAHTCIAVVDVHGQPTLGRRVAVSSHGLQALQPVHTLSAAAAAARAGSSVSSGQGRKQGLWKPAHLIRVHRGGIKVGHEAAVLHGTEPRMHDGRPHSVQPAAQGAGTTREGEVSWVGQRESCLYRPARSWGRPHQPSSGKAEPAQRWPRSLEGAQRCAIRPPPGDTPTNLRMLRWRGAVKAVPLSCSAYKP